MTMVKRRRRDCSRLRTKRSFPRNGWRRRVDGVGLGLGGVGRVSGIRVRER